MLQYMLTTTAKKTTNVSELKSMAGRAIAYLRRRAGGQYIFPDHFAGLILIS
jgi:hypothetical protein